MPDSLATRRTACRNAALAAAIVTLGLSSMLAQSTQPTHQGVSHPPAAAANKLVSQPTPSMPAAPPTAASLLEQPPTPATISAHRDSLSIKADNASLTQTLLRIADQTGMHLEGLNGDQRVFGTYGPGAPRDVLNALLEGTGYNVLMVGALDSGAPRQLILSQAKSGNAPQAQPQPEPAQPAASDDDGNNGGDPSSDDQMPTPPQTFQPSPGDQNNLPNGRTPQQMLQQLQEQRQQQQQQSAPE